MMRMMLFVLLRLILSLFWQLELSHFLVQLLPTDIDTGYLVNASALTILVKSF